MRGLRRRLFHMNPVTSFLVVIFIASVVFLISAARKNLGHQTLPAVAATGFGGSVDDSDTGRLSMSADAADRQQHQAKHRSKTSENGPQSRYMVVGDDDIQTCHMTLEWATGSRNAKETSAGKAAVVGRSTDANEQRERRQALCDIGDGDKSDESLFYVNGGDSSIRVNRTWLQHHGDAELVSCDYRVVRRLSDAGSHDQYGFSESKSIDRLALGAEDVVDVGPHEFVHITCQLSHRSKRLRMPSTVGVDAGRRQRRLVKSDQTTSTYGGGNRNNDEIVVDDEKRSRRRRHTLQLVGDGGLPDTSLRMLGLPGAGSDVDDRRRSAGVRKSSSSSSQKHGVGRSDGFTNDHQDNAKGETDAGKLKGIEKTTAWLILIVNCVFK